MSELKLFSRKASIIRKSSIIKSFNNTKTSPKKEPNKNSFNCKKLLNYT